jgi:hypothetical protein
LNNKYIAMNKVLIGLTFCALSISTFAGNPDRKGEAGAVELNINGYARSAGLWALNCASVKGLEAERLNPAGLAYVRRTEIIGAYTSLTYGRWSYGSAGRFCSAYQKQCFCRVLSIHSVLEKSTERLPTHQKVGLGTFSPTFLILD